MNTDERPESLAAQAAAWVPPWERVNRPADARYAAEARAAALAAAEAEAADLGPDAAVSGDAEPARDDDAAGGDDDAAGPAVEVREVPPMPGEVVGPVTVDAPQVLPGEQEPAPTELGAPDVVEPDVVAPATEPTVDTDNTDAGTSSASVDAATPVDSPVPMAGGDGSRASGDPGADEDPGAGEPTASGIPTQTRGRKRSSSSAGTAARRTVRAATDRADAAAEPGDEAPLPPIDDSELRGALEAILLVVDEPVGELQLAQIMEQPAERVAAMLEEISAGYTAAGHGFDLRRAAGGWRLYTRVAYAPYVERFVLDGQSVRLTQAALETLAVVAYKQPVSRSRISVIRGVNCDGVMRTLVTRGLIEECGTEPETGAYLYRTTALFLEKLGLNSVDELPPLAPFLPDDVEEVLDAQQ